LGPSLFAAAAQSKEDKAKGGAYGLLSSFYRAPPTQLSSRLPRTPPSPRASHTIHSLTLLRPPFYAGKAAAIEERVKNMDPDEAQAARAKAAEDARKSGA
jgi:hypothetical protein